MHDNILYCFISHKASVYNDVQNISTMCYDLGINDYLIVSGASDNDYIDNEHMLFLNCDDTYEGLPDKINKMFKYLHINFPKYAYYGKLDRLTKIKQPLSIDNMRGDYCGSWVKVREGYDGDRKWHFGKCSKDSIWNKKTYPGKFIPWCRGWGYFLSPKAARVVANNPPRSDYHIYEDLYVSETLLKYGNIIPNNIKNLTNFIIDSEFMR